PLAVAVALAPAVLDLPLDVGPPVYHRARGDLAPLFPPGTKHLTPGIVDAMRWLRGHSDPDDVFIVNTHYLDAAHKDPRYFYFSALAERRTYLGGWGYSAVSPAELAARLRFNAAAVCGDSATLARLRRDAQVRWVVIDKAHGPSRPPGGLPRAYSNRDVDIYRVVAGMSTACR
ncbi:MAG TPA: hypothetical protein VI300_30080, partial [Solirubrobacter sp.]